MQDVPIDAVQVVTGAYEALVTLMWLAAGPGANVARGAPAACHGDRRSLEGVLDCACAHRMDVERDAQRRQQYWTARAYFSICNTTLERFFRRWRSAGATSFSARRRRWPAATCSSLIGSWRIIAMYWVGFDRRAALPRFPGWSTGQTPGRSARLPQMKGFSSRRAIASICRRTSAWALPPPATVSRERPARDH